MNLNRISWCFSRSPATFVFPSKELIKIRFSDSTGEERRKKTFAAFFSTYSLFTRMENSIHIHRRETLCVSLGENWKECRWRESRKLLLVELICGAEERAQVQTFPSRGWVWKKRETMKVREIVLRCCRMKEIKSKAQKKMLEKLPKSLTVRWATVSEHGACC